MERERARLRPLRERLNAAYLQGVKDERERWTRVDDGHMNVEVTMEDPGAYTKPFTVHFQARLTALPGDEIMEYICQENNQYGVAQGITPAPK